MPDIVAHIIASTLIGGSFLGVLVILLIACMGMMNEQ